MTDTPSNHQPCFQSPVEAHISNLTAMFLPYSFSGTSIVQIFWKISIPLGMPLMFSLDQRIEKSA
jgi:hypothetical protein